MRTTLTVDDDVLLAAREQALRERRSVGSVLSDLARQTLTGQHRSNLGADAGELLGFEPFPSRGRAVSNALIDRLREDESE